MHRPVPSPRGLDRDYFSWTSQYDLDNIFIFTRQVPSQQPQLPGLGVHLRIVGFGVESNRGPRRLFPWRTGEHWHSLGPVFFS